MFISYLRFNETVSVSVNEPLVYLFIRTHMLLKSRDRNVNDAMHMVGVLRDFKQVVLPLLEQVVCCLKVGSGLQRLQ